MPTHNKLSERRIFGGALTPIIIADSTDPSDQSGKLRIDIWDHATPGVHKFGATPSFDNGDLPIDVFDPAAPVVYAGFIAAATTCQLSSTDPDDTAAGIGAQSITVEGLDANGLMQSVTVNTNGVGNVALGTFLRIFRAYVATAGASGFNEGRITIETTGNVLMATISPELGQTLMAIYTVPADYDHAHLIAMYATLRSTNAAARTSLVSLQSRKNGSGSWRTREYIDVSYPTPVFHRLYHVPIYDALEDLRLRVLSVSAATSFLTGGFDLKFCEGTD